MSLYTASVNERPAMGEKSFHPAPVIKGDKLVLDFGKTILRPGQQADETATERKLPPVPGRVPAEEDVPEDQVLNRGPKPGDGE
jgi:hypothetical protein